MRRTRQRPRASARLAAGVLGALVAWLVAGAHLASTLHFVLVSHQVCGAHGELEHADEAHAAPAHGADAHDAQVERSVEPSFTAVADSEHHHCGLLGPPRDELVVAPAARLAVAPAPRTPSAPVARTVAHAPDPAALLLAAPKQSPPA